jgi:hypothetical protein
LLAAGAVGAPNNVTLDATLETVKGQSGAVAQTAAPAVADTSLLDASRLLAAGAVGAPNNVTAGDTGVAALPGLVSNAPAASPTAPAINSTANGVPAGTAAVGAAADAVFGDLSSLGVNEPLMTLGPASLA